MNIYKCKTPKYEGFPIGRGTPGPGLFHEKLILSAGPMLSCMNTSCLSMSTNRMSGPQKNTYSHKKIT